MEPAMSSKEAPLDELTKEELIKKCRRFLALAQKVKLSKDECAEELRKTKEHERDFDQNLNLIVNSIQLSHINLEVNEPIDTKTSKNQLHLIKAYIDSSNKLIDTKSTELIALHETLSRLNQKLSDFEIKKSEDAEKLSHYGDLCCKADTVRTELEMKNQDLINKLKLAEEKYAIVDKKLVEFQDKYMDEKKHHAKLQTLLEKLEEKSERSSIDRSESREGLQPVLEIKEMEGICEKLNESQSKIEKLQATNKDLKKQIVEADERYNTSQVNNTKLMKKLRKLCVTINECSSNVSSDLTLTLEKLQLSNAAKEKLHLENEHLNKRLNELEEDKKRLQNSVKLAEGTIGTFKKTASTTAVPSSLRKDFEGDQFVSEIESLQSLKGKVQELEGKLRNAEELKVAFDLQQKVERTEIEANVGKLESESNGNFGNDFRDERVTNVVNQLKETKENIISQNKNLEDTQLVISDLNTKITQLTDERIDLHNKLQSSLENHEEEVTLMKKQLDNLLQSNNELVLDNSQLETLHTTIASLNQQLSQLIEEKNLVDNKCEEITEQFSQSKILIERLEADIQQSNEKGASLKQNLEEFEIMKRKVNTLNDISFKLQRLGTDVANMKVSYNIVKSNVLTEFQTMQQSNLLVGQNTTRLIADFVQKLVDSNSELLSEMNMMNQALKERGESISKMEEDMAALHTKCSESDGKIKKLTERIDEAQGENEKLRSQVEAREKTIRDMEEEIWRIRGQDASADTLSTSTISRVEESVRLMEVEDSFEDRYNKLKIVAVKLKKKVTELQNQLEQERGKLVAERTDFEAKVAHFQSQARTLNALQADYDRLQDQAAADRREMNELRKTLDKAREENVGLRKNSEEIKQEREKFKQEKMSFDIIKKELTGQIQSLKKSVEKEQAKAKEFDKIREKYEQDIRTREKKLEEESERHRATISSLEEQRMEQKKHSLLSLEMADYERTVTDLSKKLEIKEGQMRELESSLATQRELSKSLQEQILGLETRISAEQHSADSAKLQANGLQDTAAELRAELASKAGTILDQERACQQSKLEAEKSTLELAVLSAEKAKIEDRARTMQETLSRDNRVLEDKLVQQQEIVDRKDLELTELRQEFDSYKVRAQSVLRQSQKDLSTSRQHDIEEEVQILRDTSNSLRTKVDDAVRRVQVLQDDNQALTEEKIRQSQKVQELMASLADMRATNSELQTAERRAREEGEDSCRLLRVQLDTLAQCYKKEIEGLKTKHKTEIDGVHSALSEAEKQLHLHVDTGHPGHKRIPSGGRIQQQTEENAGHRRQSSANFVPVKTERETLDVLMLEREACEGSESVDSTSPRLVPLDQLLSPQTPAADLATLAERLEKSDNRIQHLTDLLSDAESDAARLQQLNEVLKEEIRRRERNEAREQHAHNLEYLKNIVVKFSTLPRGDERLRLVPVLNTILKLSPDEEARLSNAARGGIDGNGWGSYLGGMWSTTQ